MIIVDATPSGTKLPSFTLDSLTEKMSVRELIRARIWQEVRDFNQYKPAVFRGLVQPTLTEKVLNGFKLKTHRKIDWEKQFEQACEAFERNGFFILIENRQAERLEEIFVVKVDTEVSFVKLTPLVGG